MLYAGIMTLAVALGAVLARPRHQGLGLAPAERRGIAVGAFCGAMVGAKLPFLFDDWNALLSGAAWFSDGKTILTGLVGGYLGVEVAKWALDIRVKTGDSFAVPVAAAIGIGRLACFAGGCCYGTPTDLPWGVAFAAVDQLPRHPTQLYEAAFHLLAAGELERLRREGRWRGQLFKAYVVAYCVYRFATEWIRPEARLWGGLTGYQWACLAIAALMLWLWRRDTTTATA